MRQFAIISGCLIGIVLNASPSSAQVGETRLPSASERVQQWKQRKPNELLYANISFGSLVADAQARQFLQRHNLKASAVFMAGAGKIGAHRVSASRASAAAIAEARQATMEMLRSSQRSERLRAQRFLKQNPADSVGQSPRARAFASALERNERLRTKITAGDPIIYGLQVVGSADAVVQALSDPLVRQGEPAVEQNGRVVIPRLEIPEELRPDRDLDPMQGQLGDAVLARIKRAAGQRN